MISQDQSPTSHMAHINPTRSTAVEDSRVTVDTTMQDTDSLIRQVLSELRDLRRVCEEERTELTRAPTAPIGNENSSIPGQFPNHPPVSQFSWLGGFVSLRSVLNPASPAETSGPANAWN
jgi:hypothetical protein